MVQMMFCQGYDPPKVKVSILFPKKSNKLKQLPQQLIQLLLLHIILKQPKHGSIHNLPEI